MILIASIISFLYLTLPSILSICPIDDTSFITNSIVYPTLSSEIEIIGGLSYGHLYATPLATWMLYEFNASKSVLKITNSCPVGWVPPTQTDLTNLISYASNLSSNYSILTNPKIFNMNTINYYASNTKVNPTNYNNSDNNAYKYYGIKLSYSAANDKISATIGIFSAYFQSSTSKVFCISSNHSVENSLKSQAQLSLSGVTTRDLIKGIKYTFDILSTNLIAFHWNINNFTNNSKTINLIPMKYGKFQINVKATMFDGSVNAKCLTIWVRNYTGSEANTSLSLQDFHQIKFIENNKNIYASKSLHFSSGAAPLAPIDTGGSYIIYAVVNSNMNLFVKTIDNEGKQIREIDLNRRGYPMDIVAVDWGFVVMILDYDAFNTLYLLGINVTDNSIAFNRIIMDNEDKPIKYNNDQLIFFKDNSGTPNFGMEAMFEPSSGKLLFAKDRIVCFFAHYNHFGNNSDGTRSDHTGDTLVTFNLSGKDEKLAFSWGASHSLSQSLVYNGDRAIMSSLGDAYPLNIRLTVSDISNSNNESDPYTGKFDRLDETYNQSPLDGIIPGSAGFSCGRMGTLSVFGDGEFNTLSYSRRNCQNVDFKGIMKSSNISQMGLISFDNDLNKKLDVNLKDGTYVNQVQSVKYGNNLFYSYVTSLREMNTLPFLKSTVNETSDVMTIMLLNQNGSLISGPFNLTKTILPSSDDLRILNDGRVAWTYVDQNGSLYYYYLTKPEQTPTNYDLVARNAFYKNESFYLINPNDKNVYKDKIYGVFLEYNNSTNNNSTNSSTNNTSNNIINDSNTTKNSSNATNSNSNNISSNETKNTTNNNSNTSTSNVSNATLNNTTSNLSNKTSNNSISNSTENISNTNNSNSSSNDSKMTNNDINNSNETNSNESVANNTNETNNDNNNESTNAINSTENNKTFTNTTFNNVSISINFTDNSNSSSSYNYSNKTSSNNTSELTSNSSTGNTSESSNNISTNSTKNVANFLRKASYIKLLLLFFIGLSFI